MSLLSNATSALLVYQRALNTTSHNIANVNTAGFTRQTVDFTARTVQGNGGLFSGDGVDVTAVKRNYDAFLTDQLRTNANSFRGAESYQLYAQRLDNLMADPNTGLATRFQDFFSATHSVANDPSSPAARQQMLTNAQSLATRFNELGNEFTTIDQEINKQVVNSATLINQYASSIANLNNQIRQALTSTNNSQTQPNDLMDQRDQLVRNLAEQVNVQVMDQGDGTLQVSLGNGQPLVVGTTASRVTPMNSTTDPGRTELGFVGSNGTFSISDQVTGGVLGGALTFRRDVLTQVENEVGRNATVFATSFNAQHTLGIDLNGVAGGAFFAVGAPQTSFSSTNVGTGSVTATISNAGALMASDYTLTYDPAGVPSLTRQSDGAVVAMTGTGVAADPFVADGLSLVVSGAPSPGDSFQIRPVRQGAQGIGVQITSIRAIAASATGAVGDNQNALSLAALQTQRSVENGSMTFQEASSQTVGFIGTSAYQAGLNYDTQKLMLNNAQKARDQVSGVNLDEEAANLVRYQQAYQAAAKAISVADEVFKTLLSSVSR